MSDSSGFHRGVIALGIARMADAVANSFLVIVLPLFIASEQVQGAVFGLSEAAVTGVILSVFGIFNAIVQPFVGRVSDVSGRRRIFVFWGLVAMAALNLSYSFVGSYAALLGIRLLQGIAAAVTIVTSVALVNELSTFESRGGNMGIYNSLRLIGFGGGPLAAGFLVANGPYDVLGLEITGFHATFYMATLFALVSAGLVVLLVRDPERHVEAGGDVAIAILDRTGRRTLDPIFTLGVATLIMAAAISLLAPIEPQVNARLDQGPEWFGVQFAVFILTLAAVQPYIGRLTDRWGRLSFILWGLVFLAPTTLAQGMVSTPWTMVAARLAQGLAAAMVFAPALALAGDLAREGQSGLQLSVLTMAFGLGLSAGQLSAGFLVGWGYVVPFAVGAVTALLAAALVWSQVEEPARA